MLILKVVNQKDLINEADWDYLIILDACRYDYFEKVYRNFFQGGGLQRVRSPGSCTEEWLKETFRNEDYRDLVYVSSMPHVNSKGIDVFGFKAGDGFKDVIDVWDWGWDTELETVPPQKVNDGVAKALEKYPHSRMVVHYAQPHGPYLSLEPQREDGAEDSTSLGPISNWLNAASSNPFMKMVKRELRKGVGRKISRIIGQETVWRIREFFGEEPSGLVYKTVREFGKEKLREAYMKNLEKALESVSDLMPRLYGNVVMTADHGESLGENGSYGHGARLSNPELREVPWFEIFVGEGS